jgi:hypothetical protein
MSPQSITDTARAIEARDIHLAACRYRRQGLVCSTCAALVRRAEVARTLADILGPRCPEGPMDDAA